MVGGGTFIVGGERLNEGLDGVSEETAHTVDDGDWLAWMLLLPELLVDGSHGKGQTHDSPIHEKLKRLEDEGGQTSMPLSSSRRATSSQSRHTLFLMSLMRGPRPASLLL